MIQTLCGLGCAGHRGDREGRRGVVIFGAHPIMETSVRILEEHKLITLKLGGLFSVAEMFRMIEDLVKDSDYFWTCDRLSFVKASSNMSEMSVPDQYSAKEKVLGTVFGGVEGEVLNLLGIW